MRDLPEIGSWINFFGGLAWMHARVVNHTGRKERPLVCRYFHPADIEDWYREDWHTIWPHNTLSDEYSLIRPEHWYSASGEDAPCQAYDRAELEFFKFAGERIEIWSDDRTLNRRYFPCDYRAVRFPTNYRIKLFFRKYQPPKPKHEDGGYGQLVRLIFFEDNPPEDRISYIYSKAKEFYKGTPMEAKSE